MREVSFQFIFRRYILDVMMPQMDGYEFTKILRENHNNLPILMISAKQLPQDKRQAFLVDTGFP